MSDYSVKIKRSDDLKKRVFISICLNGKRTKEYTGLKIGLDIKPNYATSVYERDKQLQLLEYEFRKAIDIGNYPPTSEINHTFVEEEVSIRKAFQSALNQKLISNLNIRYKQNLTKVHSAFISYLGEENLDNPISTLKVQEVQNFLNQFQSSNTYYMDKRRDLGVLLSKINNLYDLNINLIKKTERRKPKSVLHQTYDEKQIHLVLNYLKKAHENLYLCCLLSYGCFLRPHIEVRKLKGRHFKNDFSEIHLSGEENKSGRVRVTPIPKYVKEAIIERARKLLPNQNLFTGTADYFNENYFSKAWSRQAKKMRELGLLSENQTIYSFRHTAAINVYKKTKDLHILQQLLGHSDMIVTLKYLRGLGVHNADELKHVMPEL